MTVELASRAIRHGTAPLLERSYCSPADIARDNGLLTHDTSRLAEGIRAAVSSGLVRVVSSGNAIRLPDKMFFSNEKRESNNLDGKAEGFWILNDNKQTTIPTNTNNKSIKSKRGRGRPGVPAEREIALFNQWRIGLGKTKRSKLDQKRLRAIRKATREATQGGLAFTMADLEQSIDGWCRICHDDPWRMEQPSRHELTLFLRDSEHIEWGIEALQDKGDGDLMNAIAEAEGRRAAK